MYAGQKTLEFWISRLILDLRFFLIWKIILVFGFYLESSWDIQKEEKIADKAEIKSVQSGFSDLVICIEGIQF